MSSKKESILTSVFIFLVVLALGSIYDLIVFQNPDLPLWAYEILYLTIPAISLVVFVALTNLSKSSLSRQGYCAPSGIKTRTVIILSLALFSVYLLTTFTQGAFGAIGTFTFPTTLTSILFRVGLAILFGFANESVFRGYILRNLTNNFGLFPSLYVSSLMFSLSKISIKDISMIASRGPFYVFIQIVPLFAMGLFLGYFFYKTRWSLIGPLTFQIAFLLFFEPTPLLAVDAEWTIALIFEMLAISLLIILVESIIKEPTQIRRKYGIE